MKLFVVVAVLAACVTAETYFSDDFTDGMDKWTQAGKDGLGSFELTNGKFGDNQGIKTAESARFYDLSAKFASVFDNEGKTLVVQFTVKHEQDIDCGGGYLKVLGEGLDQSDFQGDSDYQIMFGPDICGFTKKIHAIFNYNGKNLLWKKEPRAETDVLTHIYTLVVKADNTYSVLVDGDVKESGNLVDDWEFLEPKTIPDPAKPKPEDWVETKMIADPEDVKPAGYDDAPAQIADPKAEKPEDWDDEDDGEWNAPMIDNPDYKGPWSPKMIDNPEYKGEYVQPDIENPDYNEDSALYLRKPMSFVGLDLWQVKAGTIFDNFLITDDEAAAADARTSIKEFQANEKAEKEGVDKVAADKAVADKAAAAEKEAAEKAEKEAAEKEAAEAADAEEGDDVAAKLDELAGEAEAKDEL